MKPATLNKNPYKLAANPRFPIVKKNLAHQQQAHHLMHSSFMSTAAGSIRNTSSLPEALTSSQKHQLSSSL